MPLGIDYFRFTEFLVFDDNSKAKSTIEFTFDDQFDDGSDCAHIISMRVRVSLPSNSTIEQLQDASLEMAVNQLRHALQVCENKSAKEVVLAAKQDTQERQKKLQEESDKALQKSLSSIGGGD